MTPEQFYGNIKQYVKNRNKSWNAKALKVGAMVAKTTQTSDFYKGTDVK